MICLFSLRLLCANISLYYRLQLQPVIISLSCVIFIDSKFSSIFLFLCSPPDGELYTGTVSNFQGNEPVIYKSLGQGTALKTENSLKWLQGKLPCVFFLPQIFHYVPTTADKLQKAAIISEAHSLMHADGEQRQALVDCGSPAYQPLHMHIKTTSSGCHCFRQSKLHFAHN